MPMDYRCIVQRGALIRQQIQSILWFQEFYNPLVRLNRLNEAIAQTISPPPSAPIR